MNSEDLKVKILALLTDIAPDIDPATIEPGIDFRQQFDFDSMDQLDFAIALHKAFGLDIPEADYPQLASLAKCIAYVEAKASAGDRR